MWPELLLVHVHIFNLERKCLQPNAGGGGGADNPHASSPSGFTSSTSPKKRHQLSATSPASSRNIGSTPSPPSPQNNRNLTLYDKTVLSLLLFWVKLLKQQGGQHYAGRIGGELAFLCLPLCGSHQVRYNLGLSQSFETCTHA